PAHDLPVAANPAVAPAHVSVVARRRLLEQLHVAQQARAGVAAFEQVVAQDAVFWQTPAEHMLERVDVVDALADERAFAEQVLIDVTDGARVGIDARLAAEQARIARARRARQAHADPRLQDAVALDDTRRFGATAEARPVQRVRHRADELPGRVARQLGVGVERDDVAHAPQQRRVADDQRKALAWAGARAAAKQRIQVGELAALALIAHPDALARVPAPRPMEQVGALGALVARRGR